MHNGTVIACLYYVLDNEIYPVGNLHYFRTGEARLCLAVFPIKAILRGITSVGKFRENFKVEEPPEFNGAIVTKNELGEKIIIGDIHSEKKADGIYYLLSLKTLPIGDVLKVYRGEVDKHCLWLNIEMEV